MPRLAGKPCRRDDGQDLKIGSEFPESDASIQLFAELHQGFARAGQLWIVRALGSIQFLATAAIRHHQTANNYRVADQTIISKAAS